MDVRIRKSAADPLLTVVEVSGRVDKFTAPLLGEELEVLIRVGAGRVAVDLVNAESVSNEGLRVLLDTQKAAREYQCLFGLLRLPLKVEKVFEFAGLAGAFKVYRTEAEAARAFAGAGGQAGAGRGRTVLEVFGPGRKESRRVELDKEKIYGIGRFADNEICLEDNALSRLHARVFFENGEFVLEDLNSANGTFLADPRGGAAKKLARRELRDGDRIELGESMICVRKELR